jgi:hypothetical protein
MKIKHPYRKPTQVEKSSRLRCARVTTLRNSANLPRNFGIRGAIRGEKTCSSKLLMVATKRPRQLFSKNIALC